MRAVKMQRALEICVEYAGEGGYAYRKAWAERAGFKKPNQSPYYIGVYLGVQNLQNQLIEAYICRG